MIRKIIVVISLLITAVSIANAQNEQCLALAEAALNSLESCADASGNSACYGMAAEAEGIEEGFAQAGDTVSLSDITMLRTMPLSLEESVWGMARVNVHANVPLTISEEGLALILIGDAVLENTVPAENAFMPVEPVKLQALVGSNLRSFPSTDGRVLGSAAVGSELLADGRNAAGDWVHVTYEGIVAWVSSSIVTPVEGGDISSLPVLTDDSQTPMQASSFSSGIESSECTDESPSMLVVQSPDTVDGSITVNGIDILFSGTIALRMLPDQVMQLVVLSGSANSSRISIPPGFTMTIQLNGAGNEPAGSWTALRPITNDERGFFGVLELMPSAGLYSAMTVPTEEQVTTTLQTINQQAAGATVSTSDASGPSGSCEGFRPTSPLDGLAFGSTDFYWDGAQNVTQYRVNIYRDGELARSETIDAFTTSTAIDTSSGGIGDGASYGWNVEALADGEVVCTTGTVTLLRSAAAQAAGGGDDGGGGGDDNKCNWGCD